MRKIILLSLLVTFVIPSFSIYVSALNSNYCQQDEDCIIKNVPYCCGNNTDDYKDCFTINKTLEKVDCTSIRSCPGFAFEVNSCKCENNKCVGKPEEPNPDCKSLFYFDNDNKNCKQKEFCGTYMYQGLQTFENGNECIREVIKLCPLYEQPECGNGSIVSTYDQNGCIRPICEIQINCPVGTTEDENKCKKTLSNGRKAEIKIMPSTASQKAIERLGELGFNITLKEVGNDKVAYELTAEKEGKILGIFKAKGKVSAEIDAETGEVTKINKPWWAFLASRI